MTFNEFKFCCAIFCNNFKGIEYGNIVDDCYREDYTIIVNNGLYYDYTYPYIVKVRLRPNDAYIMHYDSGNLVVLKFSRNISLKTVKDFLNHFNITLEDIV